LRAGPSATSARWAATEDVSFYETTEKEALVSFQDMPRPFRKHVDEALELYQLQLDIAETFATPLEVFSLYL
jgi:hypothetical protein